MSSYTGVTRDVPLGPGAVVLPYLSDKYRLQPLGRTIQMKMTVIRIIINSNSQGPVPAARPPAQPSRGHLHCTGLESPTIRHGVRAANKTSRRLDRPAGRGGEGAARLPPRGQSVRRHSPTRAHHEAAESPAERPRPPGAAHCELRCKKPGVGDASQTQPPRRAQDLRSSAPLLPPPSLRFSVVAAVADKCDVGRRELPLSQAASASASPALAHCRGRRRIYLQGGRASAGEQERRALCAESARTRPAPARARARGAAAATRCRGEGPRRGGGGGGGGRHLCRAGVTEVKYMLTMGRPRSLGRAGGRPPSQPRPLPCRLDVGLAP